MYEPQRCLTQDMLHLDYMSDATHGENYYKICCSYEKKALYHINKKTQISF